MSSLEGAWLVGLRSGQLGYGVVISSGRSGQRKVVASRVMVWKVEVRLGRVRSTLEVI